MIERNMSVERRAALESLVLARDILGGRRTSEALYWAFIAGQKAAGRDYVEAKREAAALGLLPAGLHLQDSEE